MWHYQYELQSEFGIQAWGRLVLLPRFCNKLISSDLSSFSISDSEATFSSITISRKFQEYPVGGEMQHHRHYEYSMWTCLDVSIAAMCLSKLPSWYVSKQLRTERTIVSALSFHGLFAWCVYCLCIELDEYDEENAELTFSLAGHAAGAISCCPKTEITCQFSCCKDWLVTYPAS